VGVSIGHGRQAINLVGGNQAFSASMDGETPKLVLFWLVPCTADGTPVDDAYVSRGACDGTRFACQDFAAEHGVVPTVGRRAFTGGNVGVSAAVARLRRMDVTSDVTNNSLRLDFVSFSAETVTLNVITPPAGAYLLEYVLIGGSDFSAFVDVFTNNLSTPQDRTGLGVPAEAAVVWYLRHGTGTTSGTATLHEGYWSASAHSSRAAVGSDFGHNDTPSASEMEVRDDVAGVSVHSGARWRVTLAQIATGYRITSLDGDSSSLHKVVVAMSFNKTRVAWAGVMPTATSHGAHVFATPRLRPDLVLGIGTRRATANAGDDAFEADSAVVAPAVWTPSAQFSLAASAQNGANPSVAKASVASRFLTIPQVDGTLTGDPTTPQAGDAILATAAEHAQGLTLTYTRTSSVPRLVPMLVIGDEQTLAPDPVQLGTSGPAATVKQLQLPGAVALGLNVPSPFIGIVRPLPVQLGLVVPEPSLLLELPPPAPPKVRGPLADFYLSALWDLLPRGHAWNRREDTVLGRFLRALASELELVEFRGQDVREEADLRTTKELLSEWEAFLGTRDDCPDFDNTELERRFAVFRKYTSKGGQSIYHVVETAQALGYDVDVDDVVELKPFRCGISSCGDPLGSEEWAFVAEIHAPVQTPRFFRTGTSVVGEPLTSFGNDALVCTLDKIKPAHVLFLYRFDKAYAGYAPWHILFPSPVALPLSVPPPTRT
jgi:uncharacterized protein YmfQ (DUF2313 family)